MTDKKMLGREPTAEMVSGLYAPKAAAKIAEAARLIREAGVLLDRCGSPQVIAEVEKVEGAEFINADTAKALEALAERLEQ